jgi:hypothetical protein
MHAGVVNGGLTLSGKSRGLLNGGSNYIVQMRNNSELHIRGGRITDELFVEQSGVVHFYGTGLRFDIDPFEEHPIVAGKFANGDSISVNYHIRDQGKIILHEVPEPATWALLAIGAAGWAFFRRRVAG